MKITKNFINKAIFLTSMSDIAFILLIFIVIVSLIGSENQQDIPLPYSLSNNQYNDKSIKIYIYNNFILLNDIKIVTKNNNLINLNIKTILSKYNRSFSIKIFSDRYTLFFHIVRIIKLINELKFNKFEFATISKK